MYFIILNAFEVVLSENVYSIIWIIYRENIAFIYSLRYNKIWRGVRIEIYLINFFFFLHPTNWYFCFYFTFFEPKIGKIH